MLSHFLVNGINLQNKSKNDPTHADFPTITQTGINTEQCIKQRTKSQQTNVRTDSERIIAQ